MASAATTASNGRHRGGLKGSARSSKSSSLDFEINLVPMIDLLSVCICFLLLTAVWTQTATLKVDSARQANVEKAARSVGTNETAPMILRISADRDSRTASGLVKPGTAIVARYLLIAQDGTVTELDRTQLQSEDFSQLVQSAKAVVVAPESQVRVQDVVAAIDALKKRKVRQIQVEAGV